MRLAFGVAGIAAASAIATALVRPQAPPPQAGAQAQLADIPVPTPVVRHVTRIVHLLPGQTPPPQAVVTQAPAPSPRVVVVVTTRQSGSRP